ncbi:MAG: hypothetical protein JNJ72_20065, partial [Anaerolineales bacterium]|nr:hypothetical protein [Anaerolineales bacterium]
MTMERNGSIAMGIAGIAIGLLIGGCGEAPPPPKPAPAPEARKWEAQLPFAAAGADLQIGGACNFDQIDGKSRDLPSFQVTRATAMKVQGWAALEVAAGLPATDVALALRDGESKRRFAGTARERRDDVGNFFGK